MRVLSAKWLWVAEFGIVLALACAAIRPLAAKAAAKGQAEDMRVVDLRGYKEMVAGYRGRPLLVTFWATWCGPCRDEFPMIVSLAKEYEPQGLAVVGVSLDEQSDLPLVRKFLADAHPDFPNFREKDNIDTDTFYQGVNPDWRGTMPQTDFYARDGHLARYFIGQKTRDAFVQAIRLIMISASSENRPPQAPSVGN